MSFFAASNIFVSSRLTLIDFSLHCGSYFPASFHAYKSFIGCQTL